MNSVLLLCVAVTIGVVLLRRYFKPDPQFSTLPPGPTPLPIIGNFWQIPKIEPWKTYTEWTRQYGNDVISYTAFGKRTIVLNSVRAVTDLLEKRGNIYSERAPNVILRDLIGLRSAAFLPYNDMLRLHRKVLNTALNPTIVRDYYPIQEREAYALMYRILESPENWRSHLQRATSSTVLTIAYGHQVTTDEDYLVALSESTMKMVTRAFSSSLLMDTLPALRYMPDWFLGASFKRFVLEGRKLCEESTERPFKEVKDKRGSAEMPPSYVTKLLDMKGSITGRADVDEEYLIKVTAASIFRAGSHTSILAMVHLMTALIMNPAVQSKAQAEIDAVIGTKRLPTFADRDSLPYLDKVLAESMRSIPVAPLGVSHAVKQDDVYNGMSIPKDSVIVANVWGILHDENVYPDPEKFWPERFDGRFPNARHPRSLVFGFNRRLCPGRHLALNSLFIQAATLLTIFTISDARDDHGNEIELPGDYKDGARMFKCTIKPRSDAAIALLKSTVEVSST